MCKDFVVDLYERHALAYDRDRSRSLQERAWLDRFLRRVPPGGTILDVGCGTGEPIARYLIERGFRVVGVDASPRMIELCRSRFPDAEWLVAHAPFPPDTVIHWRRLDVFGHEHARIHRVPSGWRLQGKVEVLESGVFAQLDYAVECDPTWLTRAVLVDGEADGRPVRFALSADGAGNWTADGQVLSAVSGALDIDLGFTPATNTLPIRRLALQVGESAKVRCAWLRFPELRLEALDQTYEKMTERSYRYTSNVDGELFSARLDTDAYGLVVHYEGLWVAVKENSA